MSRAIKFRAWDKRGGHWVPLLYVTHAGCVVDLRLSDQPDITDDVVLEQFTGLHDKNGREIFEGDIVAHERGDGLGVYIVQWEEMRAGWMAFARSLTGYGMSAKGALDMEVIGNIHENPEMLKP